MILYPAYSRNKPTFKQTKPTPGAYIIKHRDKLYIGYSGYNVVKTAYRHFQKWSDNQFRAVFPKKAQIAIIPTKTAKRAAQIERSLILKYQPYLNTYIPAPVTPYQFDTTPAPF